MSKPRTHALDKEESLIFEVGSSSRSGVDFAWADLQKTPDHIGDLRRKDMDLPGLSEPEMLRHYVRLSQKNYAIDLGAFPLGSCTMKHNPRANERMARLPGFANIHPLQPVNTVPGAWEIMRQLADWLMQLTGMRAVSLAPKAGAQGEFCALLAMAQSLKSKNDMARKIVLIPDSAHGTNPASAMQCGFTPEDIASASDGRVDFEAIKARLQNSSDVAALMLTNPNTCGLFESDIIRIADLLHASGAYLYCDGANFNALVGRVLPAKLGIDAMHINLHKTFSTPHGGGGPGAGPTVLSTELAQFAPGPVFERDENDAVRMAESGDARLGTFHGQFGTFVRALSYMLAMGRDGLKSASGDAVLNANYLLARLKSVMSPAFDGYCMHEALFNDDFLEQTGITTLDIAKGLIDEGFHPMTVYFPLKVSGAMLIEPTETESLQELDHLADSILSVAKRGHEGDPDIKSAPHYAPRRRLDETAAARHPILRWVKEKQLPASEEK